jgi:hypothetical protein
VIAAVLGLVSNIYMSFSKILFLKKKSIFVFVLFCDISFKIFIYNPTHTFSLDMFTPRVSFSETENALLVVCGAANYDDAKQQEAACETTPKSQNNLSQICEMMCAVVLSILAVVFQVLVLYALVASNVNAVSMPCGSLLWNFMFSRFVLVFVELIIFGVSNAVLQYEAIYDPIYHNMKQVAFVVISHTIYIALEVISARGAMDSTQCVAALSNVSFTNSPLLVIACYVYLAIDILAVLLATCACFLMIVAVAGE